MANLNGFRVSVPQALSETSEGHVRLHHGQHFTVQLHNGHRNYNGSMPCDAEIILNGKSVGTFRISAGQTITIERPSNDTGAFTAYNEDSNEAASIGIDRNSQSLGLIEVKFRPGNHRRRAEVVIPAWNSYETPNITYRGGSSCYCATRSCNATPKGMGIGLSGHSNQGFTTVDDLEYTEATTSIFLRLVSSSEPRYDSPRPITPVYSTGVPRKL